MGGAEEAAEGTGESMDGAETDVGEGDAAEQSGITHVGAGLLMLAVVVGGVEGFGKVAEAATAEGVGEGVGALGDEGFE